MIKLVIFDLGFTLVGHDGFTIEKYLGLINKGFKKVADYLVEINKLKEKEVKKFIRTFRRLRYDLYDQSFKEYVEYSTEYVIEEVFRKLNINYDEKLIKKCAGIFHVIEGDFWRPFPNTEKTLRELKELGLKIALLSNGPYDKGIKTLLEMYDLKKYFDLIETSASIGYTKPNPITFQTVMNKIGVSSKETIMVGDDLLNDCKGASDLGIKTIKIEKPFHFPYEIELNFKPDYIIKDIYEVVKIIKELNKIN